MATYREEIEYVLNNWYKILSKKEKQEVFGEDHYTTELDDFWYELPIDTKITIYDENN